MVTNNSGTLYIDFTHSIPFKGAKFHGGATYTKAILVSLANYVEENHLNTNIIIILLKNYQPLDEAEYKILNHNVFKHIYAEEGLEKLNFEKGSRLFLPLLSVKEFEIIKKIKKKWNIEIILTIHGLRLLDRKFDKYDYAYFGNIKEKLTYFVLQDLCLLIKKIIYKRQLKKYIPYADEIITVSNYTLSKLNNIVKINKVNIFFENTLKIDDESQIENDDYMLFVSGNRQEKNLARTLIAFKNYCKILNNPIKIKITGVSQITKENLINNLKIKNLVDEGLIEFCGYVSLSELQCLYRNALFLVYTSKSEGFGLPILEAIERDCPCIAAYGTSIPEVVGPTAYYVNPYNLNSITEGMVWMSNRVHRNTIINLFELQKKNLQERGILSDKRLCSILIN